MLVKEATHKRKVLYTDGDTQDIISAIMYANKESDKYTVDYCANLKKYKKTKHAQLKGIFDFLKRSVTYKVDPKGLQLLKSPGYLIESKTGDCKSFSNFIAGCCENLGISYKYRFVKWYKGQDYRHVYILAYTPQGEVIVDATLPHFNYEESYYKKKDIIPSQYDISSIGALPHHIGKSYTAKTIRFKPVDDLFHLFFQMENVFYNEYIRNYKAEINRLYGKGIKMLDNLRKKGLYTPSHKDELYKVYESVINSPKISQLEHIKKQQLAVETAQGLHRFNHNCNHYRGPIRRNQCYRSNALAKQELHKLAKQRDTLRLERIKILKPHSFEVSIMRWSLRKLGQFMEDNGINASRDTKVKLNKVADELNRRKPLYININAIPPIQVAKRNRLAIEQGQRWQAFMEQAYGIKDYCKHLSGANRVYCYRTRGYAISNKGPSITPEWYLTDLCNSVKGIQSKRCTNTHNRGVQKSICQDSRKKFMCRQSINKILSSQKGGIYFIYLKWNESKVAFPKRLNHKRDYAQKLYNNLKSRMGISDTDFWNSVNQAVLKEYKVNHKVLLDKCYATEQYGTPYIPKEGYVFMSKDGNWGQAGSKLKHDKHIAQAVYYALRSYDNRYVVNGQPYFNKLGKLMRNGASDKVFNDFIDDKTKKYKGVHPHIKKLGLTLSNVHHKKIIDDYIYNHPEFNGGGGLPPRLVAYNTSDSIGDITTIVVAVISAVMALIGLIVGAVLEFKKLVKPEYVPNIEEDFMPAYLTVDGGTMTCIPGTSTCKVIRPDGGEETYNPKNPKHKPAESTPDPNSYNNEDNGNTQNKGLLKKILPIGLALGGVGLVVVGNDSNN